MIGMSDLPDNFAVNIVQPRTRIGNFFLAMDDAARHLIRKMFQITNPTIAAPQSGPSDI